MKHKKGIALFLLLFCVVIVASVINTPEKEQYVTSTVIEQLCLTWSVRWRASSVRRPWRTLRKNCESGTRRTDL